MIHKIEIQDFSFETLKSLREKIRKDEILWLSYKDRICYMAVERYNKHDWLVFGWGHWKKGYYHDEGIVQAKTLEILAEKIAEHYNG